MVVYRFFISKNAILYGISLGGLLILLRWVELRFFIFQNAIEVYIGFIALLFTALGTWLALKLSSPKVKTVIIEKEVLVPSPQNFVRNEKQILESGLSNREMEVLDLMAKGLSNQEIADKLFVSINTVKTHNSNILLKLDVKRRTQAVEKAKRLSLIE